MNSRSYSKRIFCHREAL